MRLLRYYKHRQCTFVSIMKEALTARRVRKPGAKARLEEDDEEQKGEVKVFSLKP